MAPILSRLRRRSPSHALTDRSGSGAVEFVMIMPFLVLLYAGASELTLGITADRKVNNAASTISDLVTQESQVTLSQLNAMMALAKPLVSPFDVDQLTMTVTSVGIDADRKVWVDWSTDPARFPEGEPFIGLPAGIANQADRHLIVTETVFAYKPFVAFGFMEPFDMTRTAYNQPRTGVEVVCVDCP